MERTTSSSAPRRGLIELPEAKSHPPFAPLVENGISQGDGKTLYVSQDIRFHNHPPDVPYLVLRGKKIIESGINVGVWEFADEDAMRTYIAWAEEWNRRAAIESN